ncbi:MAG: sigma-70 family RNA polymerase sigma factor [Nannocystaceae bacterium]
MSAAPRGHDARPTMSSDALPLRPATSTRADVPTADARALRRELRQAAERLCPPRLAPHLDDIVHEAFLRIDRVAARTGDAVGSRRYLWKAVYTTMIDWMRREEVRRRDLVDAVDVDAIDVATPAEATPEAQADARRIGLHIHACVDHLPEARRPIVALYLQGHGAAEIAKMIGAAYKQVENLLYRGLAQVRACLRGKGVEP